MPQLREHGWLYGADPYLPLALVRLLEHRDGSGRWAVQLDVNDPQEGEEPTQVVVFEGEDAPQAARAELERIYEAGRVDGRWRIRQPDAY
jgi:hypothetical protein